MEIIPFVGSQQVVADTISIKVNPDDRRRVDTLILQTGVILAVNDQGSFTAAKRAAGQLKAMTVEIQDSKKGAKRPFAAVEKAIEDLASEVGAPVEIEHKRILSLLNGYVARLEAEAKEEARRKEEALQKQIALEQEKLRAARKAQADAEEAARKAIDEASRLRAQEESRRRQELADQAQLASEMVAEISAIGDKPKKGLVRGGRVDHNFEFKLVSVEAAVAAGCWRLLRWELDKMACKDSCNSQLELNPDAEPTLPGILVTRVTSVSVRASAKIT